MLKRKFYQLIGIDYSLLKQCDSRTQNDYLLVGILVLFNCFITAYSAVYLFDLLLDSVLVKLVLSALFVFIYSNIYRFTLITVPFASHPSQKVNYKPLKKHGFQYLFLLFMALIVSKPIELKHYETAISPYIVHHKSELHQSFTQNLQALYSDRIDFLLNEIEAIQSDGELLGVNVKQEKKSLEEEILMLKREKNQTLQVFSLKIEASSFFLYRLKVLTQHFPFSWWLTCILCVLILLPYYMLNVFQNQYANLHQNQEKNIVQREKNIALLRKAQLYQDNYS